MLLVKLMVSFVIWNGKKNWFKSFHLRRSVASLSVAPEDQFKYGYLGGNYRIVNEESPDGKVYLSQVEYRSDTTDVVAQPVLFDVQTFVQSYKTVGFSFLITKWKI